LERLRLGAPVSVIFQSEDFARLPRPSPPHPYGLLAGRSPLMAAASSGLVDVMRELLAAGADPEQEDPKTQARAVHWAASRDQVEALKALRELGVDIQARAGDSGDALAWAVYAMRPASGAALALLGWGASIDCLSDEEEAQAKSDHESWDPQGSFKWEMPSEIKAAVLAARERQELDACVDTQAPSRSSRGL
jgi:hypothetical protein